MAIAELAQFFGETCFVHGYVHNDLHFGNVLVKKRVDAGELPLSQRVARRLVQLPNSAALLLVAGYALALLAAGLACAPLLRAAKAGAAAALRALPVPTAVASVVSSIAGPAARLVELLVAVLGAVACLGVGFFGAELPDARDLAKTTLLRPSVLNRATLTYEAHQKLKSRVDKTVASMADVRFDLIIIDHGFHTHFPRVGRAGSSEDGRGYSAETQRGAAAAVAIPPRRSAVVAIPSRRIATAAVAIPPRRIAAAAVAIPSRRSAVVAIPWRRIAAPPRPWTFGGDASRTFRGDERRAAGTSSAWRGASSGRG